MSYHDSHLISLIAELKQSRNVRDQREEKMLCVVEGLLQRIERLEQNQNAFLAYALRQSNNVLTSGPY